MKRSPACPTIGIVLTVAVFVATMAYLPSSVAAAEKPSTRQPVPALKSEPADTGVAEIEPGQVPSFLPPAGAQPPSTEQLAQVKREIESRKLTNPYRIPPPRDAGEPPNQGKLILQGEVVS